MLKRLALISLAVYLRRFQEADAAAVYDLVCSTLEEEYDPQVFMILPKLWPQGAIVCENELGIVGFLLGTVTAPGQVQLLMLSVDPDLRHRGIGSEMMLKFLAECNALNCLSVELEVRKNNLNAIRFYQKFGFRLVDLKENYYHDGEDAFIMLLEES